MESTESVETSLNSTILELHEMYSDLKIQSKTAVEREAATYSQPKHTLDSIAEETTQGTSTDVKLGYESFDSSSSFNDREPLNSSDFDYDEVASDVAQNNQSQYTPEQSRGNSHCYYSSPNSKPATELMYQVIKTFNFSIMQKYCILLKVIF